MNCVGQLLLLSVVAVSLSACSNTPNQLGQCPQPRFTGRAPAVYYQRINPLKVTSESSESGENLYQHGAAKVSCAKCHGSSGNGMGIMSSMFEPPPRNFTCAKTIKGVPDGQLFWIIRNGSPGTGMPPFSKLSDQQIWQIIIYIRQLADSKQETN